MSKVTPVLRCPKSPWCYGTKESVELVLPVMLPWLSSLDWCNLMSNWAWQEALSSMMETLNMHTVPSVWTGRFTLLVWTCGLVVMHVNMGEHSVQTLLGKIGCTYWLIPTKLTLGKQLHLCMHIPLFLIRLSLCVHVCIFTYIHVWKNI